MKLKNPKAPAVKREAEEDWGAKMNVHNADYWRSRAEEARAVATQMTDAHTKAVMLTIAQDYEKLAVRAEQRTAEPH